MIKFFEGEEILTISSIALLIIIFSLVFIIPVFPYAMQGVLFSSLFTLLFFTAIFTVKKYRKEIFTAVIAITILEWISEFIDYPSLLIVSKIVNIIFFDLMVILLLIQVARSKLVSLRVIVEAINVYLLLGLVFSLLVGLIVVLDPQAFKFPVSHVYSEEIATYFSDYLYYGFVTFTTLGYGDVVPVASYAKSLAILASVTGQIYIAVVIAMLVGKFSSSSNID
jgi:hypothetical protein